MKIGIVGAGGVGGYFGAKLASAGNEVKFIARGEHLKAMQQNGLLVKSIKGDMHINPAKASDDISFLSDCELIILGIKAWQIKEVAPELAKVLNKDALVLPLQNGILAVEELSEHIDKHQILGGLCMIFSSIEAPGVINHKGLEPLITFGEPDKTIKERTTNLSKSLENADINCAVSRDIEEAIWRKFMLICLSGFGAIVNSGYGPLREVPETRQMMIDALTEVYNIAIAKNINLEPDIVKKSMEIVDGYPPNSMSSLARDVLNRKKSEIEYQNGTVVRFGKTLNIKTPVNQSIYGFIKLMEKKLTYTNIKP